MPPHEQEVERWVREAAVASGELAEAKADADGVRDSLKGSSELAEEVSGRVRGLDASLDRVNRCLEVVQKVRDRGRRLEEASSGLQNGEYERATEALAAFGEIGVAADGGQEPHTSKAEEMRNSLLSTCRSKLNSALERGDEAEVARHAKLLAKLGAEQEGLGALCSAIRSGIASFASQRYDALAGESPGDFHSVLDSLLSAVVSALDRHWHMVVESFGSGGVLTVAAEVQKECDQRGSQVLRRYQEVYDLQRLCKDVSGLFSDLRPLDSLSSGWGRGISNAFADAKEQGIGGPDPRHVEMYLKDMLRVCQRSEGHLALLSERVASCEVGGIIVAYRERD